MLNTTLVVEELQLAGVVWNRCSCGQLKPKKGHSCWRCIDRDQEFMRLDALIAAGYGSIQQSLIPRDIMERFSYLVGKPALTSLREPGYRKSA
jgi:hypothetical protein